MTGVIAAARRDVAVFARELVGEPLWAHQLAVALSMARVRVVCSGRQAGKSRTLAVLALWEAFRRPGVVVLLVSAGEDASRDLLAEVARLAGAPLLAGSVVDEGKAQVVLSNGSVVRSVPASTRQIRGKVVDLLVVDEAAFVDEDVWQAARYTVLARPDSRVVLTSTPFGRLDRFFAVAYRAGERGADGYESFHWPSTVSPLVDEELLSMWRATSTEREYQAEVLAEWVDDSGAYFRSDELESATFDFPLPSPADIDGRVLEAVGFDWGFARDASAVVGIGPAVEADGLPEHVESAVLYVAEEFGMPYGAFIGRQAARLEAFRLRRVVSELNGVGQMPTQTLERRLHGCRVEGLSTTARAKEDGFGRLKMLLEQGRLALPRHPALLRQLNALTFETTDAGSTRISVPEREGHDDLAMAAYLAASALRVERSRSARSDAGVVAGSKIPTVAVGSVGGGRELRFGDGRTVPVSQHRLARKVDEWRRRR